MADRRDQATGKTRNAVVALTLFGVVLGMTGLAFASVPLYRLFCQVTGFGGTTQVAESAPAEIGERIYTIRFNADISPDLPWYFQPVERKMTVRVGEQGLAFYRAENQSARATTGTATFNVTPLKAGQYFSKVACFCFDEQRLQAGEAMDMGVSFFVDPAILDDPNLQDVETITLSYTFFQALEDESQEQAAAGADETEDKQAESGG